MLTVALSIFFVLLFLYAAVRRMRYPFEVEWIESGVLTSVLRITRGQSLYIAPNLNFVPYLYAPLYLYLAAALTKLIGIGHGYMAMRLLSTLSTFGSCGAIYLLVMVETRRRLAALAAAGLFVGGYAALGAFYDVGRVDSLFVFLLLLALLAQRHGHPMLSGIIWVLVFQTKQTALPLGFFVLCADWQHPRRAISGVATFLIGATSSILLLNHATGGWYDFYVFHVARGLPIVWRQAALFLPSEVLEPVSIAWVIILAAMVMTRPHFERAMFYVFVSISLYGGLWFVASHRGASLNALIPGFAWTAVLFGIALARLLSWAESENAKLATVVILGAAVLQLVALVYNPGRFIPPAAQEEANWRFVEELHALPGDVYVLNHSYDAILAGKQPHAEGEALGAVLDAKLGDTNSSLQSELNAALVNHRYSAVVIDDPSPSKTSWHFEREYPLAISSPLSNYQYLTSQPEWFLLPCNAPESMRRTLVDAYSMTAENSCAH